MSDEEKGDGQNQPAYEHPPVILKRPLAEANARTATREQEERKHRKLQSLFNFFLVVFTGATAAVGVWQGILTRQAIANAARQAKAAEDANSLTRQSFEANESHTKAAIEASTAQSNAALAASIRQSQLDQRAWVGPIGMLEPSYRVGNRTLYLKEGVKASFKPLITNSGKTPARRMTTKTDFVLLDPAMRFVPHYKTPRSPGVTVLQPQARFFLETGKFATPVRKDTVDQIVGGSLILHVYGVIDYRDVFDQPHETTFCLILDKTIDGFHNCNSYNEAN